MPNLLSCKEVAEILGVCQRTIWALIKKGSLPAVRVGRRVLITMEALQEFIRKNQTVQDS